jgi:spore germination cell wall hydrolase CwlJ-like protein
MDAIKLWVWLMARRVLWIAVVGGVIAGGRFAWQYELLSFSGMAAFAKTLVWTPGDPDNADIPSEGATKSRRKARTMARAETERPTSVGTIFQTAETAPGAAPPLPVYLDRETTCLARAIYHEAAHDPAESRIAIAHVAMVRLAQAGQPTGPNQPATKASMCAVVYGGMNSVLGCLFVATCRSSGAAVPGGDAWRQAQEIASQVMTGRIDAVAATGQPLLAEATHFHPKGERPGWVGSVAPLTKVGRFVFLSRKPLEPGAVAGNREAPPTETVGDKSSEPEAKSQPAPKRPLQRAEQGGNETASKPQKVGSSDGWMNAGQ